MAEGDEAVDPVRNSITGNSGAAFQARDVHGDVTVVSHARAPETTWPVMVRRVPEQAGCFQRRAVAEEVRAHIAQSRDSGSCQVLSGLGGVGKTQLAAAQAERMWAEGDVDLLLWVSAGRRSSILSTYAQAGAVVSGERADKDVEAAADRFLVWLRTTDKRWLVVLDDVSAPGDLQALWPPRRADGHTLVTTRRDDAVLATRGRRVRVGLYTDDEAAAYVAARFAAGGRRGEPPGGVPDLVAALGRLPLALAQAVTYMLEQGIGCRQYLHQWGGRRHELAGLLPDPGSLPDEYRVTVDSTWSLSIDLADRLAPAGLARPLLELASTLSPDGVPIDVLAGIPARTYLAHHAAGRDRVEVTRPQVREALHCLRRLSLLDLGENVRVHALVQRATRDRMPAGRFKRAALAAADALVEEWPSAGTMADYPVDDVVRVLHECADSLLRCADDVLWADRPAPHAILFLPGVSHQVNARHAEAAAHWRRLRDAAVRRLGPDDPEVLSLRRRLGNSLGRSGEAADAVALMGELLADCARVLGADDDCTLSLRADLAHWQGEAGHVRAAAEAYRQLDLDCDRVLDRGHPLRVEVLHGLGEWLRRSGEATVADEAHDRMLALVRELASSPSPPASRAGRRGARGLRKPRTEPIPHEGYTRLRYKDYAGAAEVFAQALAERERGAGEADPSTWECRALIARCQALQGDLIGAEAAFTRLLGDCARRLGPDHARTRDVESTVAWLRERLPEG